MRALTAAGFAAIALVVAGVMASQALAGTKAGRRSTAAGTYRIVTGHQAPGALDTVDGVLANQAPGVFQPGAPVKTLPTPASQWSPGPEAPSGCLNAGVNWQAGYDLFGVTMWKIWNHTHWCFSNWHVTSVTGWTDVYTAPTWSSSNKSWHWAVWGATTDYSTSHADFCLASYFGCLQSASPNVHVWVNGAGNYSFDDSHWSPGN